jgi:hypothetical protein
MPGPSAQDQTLTRHNRRRWRARFDPAQSAEIDRQNAAAV